MDPPRISIQDTPAQHDVQLLLDQLVAFNTRATDCVDSRELTVFLRDTSGELTGGLYGWTWGGWLEVRYLWVHPDYRDHGYGRAMLLAAEAEAAARGCRHALVDTFSFQAPGFYRRLGYTELATVEDVPESHRRHYFTKRLRVQ